MGLLERFGLGGSAKKSLPPTRPTKDAAFMRGEQNSFFRGWRPALRDARQDVGSGYTLAAARAIDTAQNSGWIAGAIDAAIAQIIGGGLRLNCRPDIDALGISEKDAADWGRLVERRWEAWGNDPVECDLGGRSTLAQIQAAALRQWFATGDIIVALPYRKRFASLIGTKVSLIPSHRLAVNSSAVDGIVQGVKLDADAFPIGYRFQLDRPDNGLGFEQFVDMQARDALGRPNVIHVFDGGAGQVRGITPLAPALRVLRQYDQLADATLTAALIQTIFAASIESEAPTEQILSALQDPNEQSAGIGSGSMEDFFSARAGWYSETKIDLGNQGKIAHLFPGEKLHFNSTNHPNSEYEAFAKFLLREVARCIGVTFEQLTGDYTGATYSSVRMASSEFWNLTTYRRNNIIGRVVQPIFEAWLEEQVELGLIPIPGGSVNFLFNRAAFCRADWRGPPKPQADDKKAAEAHQIWKTLGVITDEMICADLGVDWEDVLEQRASELEMKKRLGLDDPPPPKFGGFGQPAKQTEEVGADG